MEKIADYAFYQNIRITSVVIPDGVKSIGDAAFSSCGNLKDMKLPESVEIIGDGAFSSCSSLENVKLPAGLTTLGIDAFSGCSGLTDIVIPDGVTGELNAFFGCSRLTTITIPSGITGIGDRAFQGCSALTSVVICDGVKSIGLGAFDGCRALKDIAIPDSVEVIGANAFRYTAWYDLLPIGLIYVGRVLYGYKGTMPAGTSLVIREGTVSIAGEAFEMALNLVSLTIPDSVKHIGAMAFFGCVFLTEIKWNAVAVGLGDMAFGGVGFRGSGIDLVFGDGVEKIPAKVFKFDDFEDMGLKGANIKSITISSTVTEIGAYAFECPSLTSVTFADGSSWQISQKVDFSDYTEIADSDLADAAIAAEYLKSTYVAYTWRKV